jgi:two-component system CheB/CheR fusion protein
MSATAPSRPLRVLVADNDRDTADSLAAVVSLWGHDAQAVHSGQGALDVTLTFRPDVILLDFGMPDLNGGKVARELRSRPGAVPLLVAVTGYGPEWVAGLYPGAFDHQLAKPPILQELQAILAAAARLPDA